MRSELREFNEGEMQAFDDLIAVLTIPTKLAVQSWQSGYGRDAIPSYRLPLIYKDKYDHILKNEKRIKSNG